MLFKLIIIPLIFGLIDFGLSVSVTSKVNDYLTVKTLNGDVRGKLEKTLFDEKPYYSFRGIPFAQPPIDELRFKRPVPIGNWVGVRDAFEFGNECAQVTTGVEDCLYLNVFTPANSSNKNLPVMFYIHGGGFTEGSPNDSGPDFLLEHDVIMVSTNYRLGVLGFMSLGTSEYSGNMGFKDQQLALQWTNDNIEFFGGDKSRITIFGESAGSASVCFQTISPTSRGLFQRAIMQSGVSLNPWTVYMKDNHMSDMMEFGQQFGNISESTEELIDFLKEVDFKLLVTELNKELYVTNTSRKVTEARWSAVLEDETIVDSFLTELPIDILTRPSATDVDILLGFTSVEMYTIALIDILYPELLEPFDRDFEIMLPKAYLKYDFDSQEYKQIARDIRKFFFPRNATVGKETLYEFNVLLSDIWFNYGIVDWARMHYHHSTGKTYLYKFSVESELNIIKQMFGIDLRDYSLFGSTHADDLFFVFRMGLTDYLQFPKNSVEIKSIQLTTKLWTNFAKYGSPTLPSDLIQLRPIEDGSVYYGDITNKGLLPKIDPFKSNIRFWDNLYLKYENVF